MKLKKRGMSEGMMWFLIIAIIVLASGGLITILFLTPLGSGLSALADFIPVQGCQERAYYAKFIKDSYNTGENLDKATEAYIEFKGCYPGEEPSIPDNMRLFFIGQEAAKIKTEGYLTEAWEKYWEILVKYPSNRYLMVQTIRAINDIHDEVIELAKKDKQPESKIIELIQNKINKLKTIYTVYLPVKGHQIPLDLVLIYIGDTYAHIETNARLNSALAYYKKTLEDYPERNQKTGEGLYAADAQNRIITLAKVMTSIGEYDPAADACFWVYKNTINYTYNYYDIQAKKTSTITPESMKSIASTCISAIGEKLRFQGECKNIKSCSKYRETYCEFDICGIGNCRWLSSLAFEGCVEYLPGEELEEKETPPSLPPSSLPEVIPGCELITKCDDYKTEPACNEDKCKHICSWYDSKCTYKFATVVEDDPQT